MRIERHRKWQGNGEMFDARAIFLNGRSEEDFLRELAEKRQAASQEIIEGRQGSISKVKLWVIQMIGRWPI